MQIQGYQLPFLYINSACRSSSLLKTSTEQAIQVLEKAQVQVNKENQIALLPVLVASSWK